ncbi:MAG: midcut-by-XrtH protein [Curvibacter sp.]|nr:midcut-by-XrtH protein [Curvibacter sp.]
MESFYWYFAEHGPSRVQAESTLPAIAAVASIPPFKEWGVALLLSVVALVAYRHLRATGRDNWAASILFASALLASIFPNQNVMIQFAYALVNAFTNPAGGNTVVTVFPTDNGAIPLTGESFSSAEIPNTSGVTQKITSITGSGTCFTSLDPTNATCAVNSTYASGATCHVAYVNGC